MRNYIMVWIVIAIAVLVPLVSAILWKIKSGTKVLPYYVGVLVWLVFVIILEQIFQYVVLIRLNLQSFLVEGNQYLYIIYAALVASLFEEAGRYFAFKVPLKKHNRFRNALAYGIGHGGFEFAYVLLSGYLPMLLAVYGVSLGAEETNIMLQKAFWAIDIDQAFLFIGERIIFFALHIGLSILVFYSVNGKNKSKLFFRAVFIHFCIELLAGLNQLNKVGVAAFEGLFVLIVIVLYVYLYKKGMIHSINKRD